MKKFLKIILFACFFIYAPESLASDKPSVVFNLQENEPYIDNSNSTFEAQVSTIINVVSEFNKKYPGDKIHQEFTEDVAARFPEMSRQQVYDYEDRIRTAVVGYRYFKNLYDEIMEKYLAPEPPPLIVDEKDYDTPYTADYIESKDTVIIMDFKKVLSYGFDRRDFAAMEARYKRKLLERESISSFDEFRKMFAKIEFKKIPFYDKFYDNPFTGKAGLGNWERTPDVSVRIASILTNINDDNKIKAALQFVLLRGSRINAQDDSRGSKIKFEITNYDNLKGYELLYPIPQRIYDKSKEDVVVYEGSFAIPLILEVEDINKPVTIWGKVSGTSCNQDKCEDFVLEPKFGISKGKGFEGAISNFLYQTYNALPKEENSDIKLKKVVVDKAINENSGQILRVVVDADNPSELSIFAENKNIQLLRPIVTIDGDRVVARFTAADKNAELIGQKFEITLNDKRFNSIRNIVEASEPSLLDIEGRSLSLAIVLLAVLGGFILNFMPCVFPVLSLKILSITRFGATNDKAIRTSFMLTIAGILSAFAILAFFLSLLKYLGYAIGWGMQFQNSTFLVCIIFVITVFMAQVWGLINIRTPNWANKVLVHREHQDNLLHFLTGLFLVVLATPCTAPYLATSLGFALAGSISDIIIVVMAVGVGLSIPYIAVAFIPNISIYMPKPGAWMDKLYKIMILMLIVTLIWLISVLSAQSGWGVSIRISFYLAVFLFILWFRKMGIDFAETKKFSARVRHKTILYLNIILLSLCGLLFVISLIDAGYNFHKKRAEVEKTTQQHINMDEIRQEVGEGKIVIMKIGADWCLTCTYNNVTVFSNTAIEETIKRYGIKIIDIDWTNYNQEVLDFMNKYGRKGLPFYIIFSPKVPEGMVLPEILNEQQLHKIIENLK